MNTSRNGGKYTPDEIRVIKSGKYSLKDIARYTNRSVNAVKRKKHQLEEEQKR